MKASIDVSAKEALKLGLDNTGIYVIDFNPADLTEPQRIELSLSRFTKEAFHVNYEITGINSSDIPYVGKADLETLKYLLDIRIFSRAKRIADDIAYKAKKKKETIAAIIDWTNKIPEDRIREDDFVHISGVSDSDLPKYYDEIQGLKEVVEDAYSLIFWKYAESRIGVSLVMKKDNAEEAAKKEEAKKIKAEEKKQLSDWVSKFGTDSQKARLAANMLSKYEIEESMRNQIFAPLSEYSGYKNIKESDFCECEYSEQSDITFSVDDKKTATEEEFKQLELMKKILQIKDAKFILQQHQGFCDSCEQIKYKNSIRVNVTIGALEFTKVFGMKELACQKD